MKRRADSQLEAFPAREIIPGITPVALRSTRTQAEAGPLFAVPPLPVPPELPYADGDPMPESARLRCDCCGVRAVFYLPGDDGALWCEDCAPGDGPDDRDEEPDENTCIRSCLAAEEDEADQERGERP